MCHLHEIEITHDPVMAFGTCFCPAEHLVYGEIDVFIDRKPRQQAVVLKHHGALRPRLVDLTVFEQNGTGRNLRQPGDEVEHRGFAAAGVADDRNEFAFFDGEVDTFQHLGARAALVEIFVDVIELQISVHNRRPLNSPQRRG